MIIETESAACRVSRQPTLSAADRLTEVFFGWEFVAQAATSTNGARATALR
jgi:hypothetical protein